jgi:hypothetical protein
MTMLVPAEHVVVDADAGCQKLLRTEVSDVPRLATHVVVPGGSAPPSSAEYIE